MTMRITSRELMIMAIALATLLDFSANRLATHYLVAVGPFLLSDGVR